jgi:hypothetical protein
VASTKNSKRLSCSASPARAATLTNPPISAVNCISCGDIVAVLASLTNRVEHKMPTTINTPDEQKTVNELKTPNSAQGELSEETWSRWQRRGRRAGVARSARIISWAMSPLGFLAGQNQHFAIQRLCIRLVVVCLQAKRHNPELKKADPPAKSSRRSRL